MNLIAARASDGEPHLVRVRREAAGTALGDRVKII